MLEAQKYKGFAADCLRIAETLAGQDKERLLKIADAWTGIALEAETIVLSRKKNPGDDAARP